MRPAHRCRCYPNLPSTPMRCSSSGKTTRPLPKRTRSMPNRNAGRLTTPVTAAARTPANGHGPRCYTPCATPPNCAKRPIRGWSIATGWPVCSPATPVPRPCPAAVAWPGTRPCGTRHGEASPRLRFSRLSTRCTTCSGDTSTHGPRRPTNASDTSPRSGPAAWDSGPASPSASGPSTAISGPSERASAPERW